MSEREGPGPDSADVPPEPAGPAIEPQPAPLVAWAPPAPVAPLDGPVSAELTVGGIVSDVFARYGADPIRLFLVSLAPALVSAIGTTMANAIGPDLRGVWASLAVSLLAAAIGIVTTSVTFALAEGGRPLATGAAVDWGISRSGWFFLTALASGALIFLVILATVVVGLVLALGAPELAGLAILIGGLISAWLVLRLVLALPAVVVDRLGPSEALSRSWRLTRRAGVWLRILAALLLIGLLLAPLSMVAGILGLVPSLSDAVAVVVTAALVAFTTPMVVLLQYSAYRRLVPPAAPVPAAPTGEPAPGPADVSVPADVVAPPRMGTGGRAILGLTIALAIVGLVSVPWAIGQLIAGRLDFPGPGFVDGDARVEFGATASLTTCTISGETTFFGPDDQMVWLAHFPRRVTPGDAVRVEVLRDDVELADELQAPGTYDCLGTEDPVLDIEPGVYEFKVYLNGELVASGTFLAL